MSLPAGYVTNTPTNYFAFGLQSAKDVTATVFYFTKHLDGSGFDVDVTANSERIGGAGREIGLRYRTKVTADGSLVAYAQPDFLGRIMAAAFNQDTVTAGPSQGTGNAYYSTHLLTSGQSQLGYYTLQQQWADACEQVTNGVFSSVKMETEAGKPVKVTAQFITGGTPTAQVTAQNPVREAAFPFMVPGASTAIVTNPYPGGTATGASSLQITKSSVEIKNQLDDNIQTVQLQREDVLWLNLDMDIDGTLKYINQSFWDQVQYGGGSVVPTGILTNGAFYFYAQNPSSMSTLIYSPFVEFQKVKVNRLDPDGKTMYLDFTASTRGGQIATPSLQVTVISGASTAYNVSTT